MSARDQIVTFYDSIDQVPRLDWVKNFFLQKPYLQMLETAKPIGMSFQYVTLSVQDEIVGFYYFQVLSFSASESLQSKPNVQRGSINDCLRSFLSNFVQFKTIVSGNLTLTGANGFELKDYRVDPEVVGYVTDKTVQYLNRVKGEEITLILLKDFPCVTKKEDPFYHKKYFPFCIEPDLNLLLRPNWVTMEDYCKDLTTKYRTRYNRARKKLAGITKSVLTTVQLEQYSETIYALYHNIAKKADFNTVYLAKDYFQTLKKQLPEETEIIGYFLEDKLVGFVSLLQIDQELEAHYIGYDLHLNAHYQLYLNMLYDIIEAGITKKCKKIGYARTATEIKSSIGALDAQFCCYLKHTKPIINRCLPALFQYLTPVEGYEKRNPFRMEQDQQ